MSHDIFDEMEDDLDSSWEDMSKELKKKLRTEEVRKQMETPVTPLHPTYKEFYEELLNAYLSMGSGSNSGSHILHKFMWSIVRNQDVKYPEKAFEEIWKMFCDPHLYQITEHMACHRCGIAYTVVSQRQRISFQDEYMGSWSSNRYAVRERTRSAHIHCTSCGTHMGNITGKVVGIYKEDLVNDFK
jgi:hypothetical protein